MSNGNPPLALLISADAPTGENLARCIQGAGIESFAFTSVTDRPALETRSSQTSPITIIDWSPGIAVPELCRSLHAQRAGSFAYVLLLLSKETSKAELTEALDAGADEYMVKPVDPMELVLRLRTMLGVYHQFTEGNAFRGDQSRALAIIADLAQDLAVADSLEEVASRTIWAVADLVCARRVAILLSDPDGRTMKVVDARGLDEGSIETIVIPRGSGLSWGVWESREPSVLSNSADAEAVDDTPEAPLLAAFPSMAMPLCGPEHVVGVLTVADRQGAERFSEFELEYVRLLSNIAAAAIHERLTRQARDEARQSIVVALAQLAEHRDFDTGTHLDRVGRFCVLLAKALQRNPRYRQRISPQFISDLERAVPLHDIGKVAIPDHILLKPRAHTAEERAMMKTHAAIGARTIASIVARVPGASFLAMAEEIAYSHHERYDGAGYPRRLRGDDIPLSARIVAVADVYDAITTRRVYKAALSHEHAVEAIIAGAGTQFDPDVVEAFKQCAEAFAAMYPEMVDRMSDRQSIAIGQASG